MKKPIFARSLGENSRGGALSGDCGGIGFGFPFSSCIVISPVNMN